MPSGTPVSLLSLRLMKINIERSLCCDNELYELIKEVDAVTFRTYMEHYNKLRRLPSAKERRATIDDMTSCDRRGPGKSKKMDAIDDEVLSDLVKEHPFFRLAKLKNIYEQVSDNQVSISTLRRSLSRSPFTLKKIDKQMSLADPIEQMEFLESVMALDWVHFISLDETSGSRMKFLPEKV